MGKQDQLKKIMMQLSEIKSDNDRKALLDKFLGDADLSNNEKASISKALLKNTKSEKDLVGIYRYYKRIKQEFDLRDSSKVKELITFIESVHKISEASIGRGILNTVAGTVAPKNTKFFISYATPYINKSRFDPFIKKFEGNVNEAGKFANAGDYEKMMEAIKKARDEVVEYLVYKLDDVKKLLFMCSCSDVVYVFLKILCSIAGVKTYDKNYDDTKYQIPNDLKLKLGEGNQIGTGLFAGAIIKVLDQQTPGYYKKFGKTIHKNIDAFYKESTGLSKKPTKDIKEDSSENQKKAAEFLNNYKELRKNIKSDKSETSLLSIKRELFDNILIPLRDVAEHEKDHPADESSSKKMEEESKKIEEKSNSGFWGSMKKAGSAVLVGAKAVGGSVADGVRKVGKAMGANGSEWKRIETAIDTLSEILESSINSEEFPSNFREDIEKVIMDFRVYTNHKSNQYKEQYLDKNSDKKFPYIYAYLAILMDLTNGTVGKSMSTKEYTSQFLDGNPRFKGFFAYLMFGLENYMKSKGKEPKGKESKKIETIVVDEENPAEQVPIEKIIGNSFKDKEESKEKEQKEEEKEEEKEEDTKEKDTKEKDTKEKDTKEKEKENEKGGYDSDDEWLELIGGKIKPDEKEREE